MVSSNTEYRALAVEAGLYYLVAYTATTLAAFGLLTMISRHDNARENVQLEDVSGLFWQQPFIGVFNVSGAIVFSRDPVNSWVYC